MEQEKMSKPISHSPSKAETSPCVPAHKAAAGSQWVRRGKTVLTATDLIPISETQLRQKGGQA